MVNRLLSGLSLKGLLMVSYVNKVVLEDVKVKCNHSCKVYFITFPCSEAAIQAQVEKLIWMDMIKFTDSRKGTFNCNKSFSMTKYQEKSTQRTVGQ